MMNDNIEQELRRIIRRNVKELWQHYPLSEEPELPELEVTDTYTAFFIPPKKVLMGLRQQDLITPTSHEVGHYLRYLRDPKSWCPTSLVNQFPEEVLAELHSMTFLDSVGVLNHVLKSHERQHAEIKRLLGEIEGLNEREYEKVVENVEVDEELKTNMSIYILTRSAGKRALKLYRQDRNILRKLTRLDLPKLLTAIGGY